VKSTHRIWAERSFWYVTITTGLCSVSTLIRITAYYQIAFPWDPMTTGSQAENESVSCSTEATTVGGLLVKQIALQQCGCKTLPYETYSYLCTGWTASETTAPKHTTRAVQNFKTKQMIIKGRNKNKIFKKCQKIN